MSQYIRFHLSIRYEQYLSVYQGISKTIRTKADDGRIIEFPASNIQTYLQKNGIHGYFEMEVSEQQKFLGIKKLR